MAADRIAEDNPDLTGAGLDVINDKILVLDKSNTTDDPTGTLSNITPAQLKIGLSLNNLDNTSDANKPVSTAQAAADLTAENNAKAYADTLVVGLIDDRGNYDASGNVFPSSGGSGTAGAVKKGDLWTISVAGTLGGNAVTAGDLVRALVDTPGQTSSNWAVTENNIGYVAENSSNKSTDINTDQASNIKYASVKAIYDWATGLFATISNLATKLNLSGGTMTGAIDEKEGASIASASTTNIGAATGNSVLITGTTTINALGTIQAGVRRIVRFQSALTLTHNATSLKLPTESNISVAAGDRAIFLSLGSGNWECIAYTRKNGTALSASGGGGDMLASNNLSEVNPSSAKTNLGLNNVDNTTDANKPVSTAQAAADLTAENNAKAYADTLVVGLIDDRGNYDASGNAFPSSGGSGSAGAVKKGDLWTISVAGTLGGNAVTAGDLVRALVDTPGQTSSNWAVTENNIGYVAENTTNKDASGGYAGLSGFKIKIKNAAGTITSLISSLASSAREWVLPDKDMTIAGLDDTTLSADASGTDTYTATIAPAITAYSATQRFYIKFPNANTGAATINLNSLGAKSIKKNGNTDLSANDIKAGQIYCIAYDGTNFQLLAYIGSAGAGGGGVEVISATLSGTQTNYAISGVDTSKNITTELRVAFSGASFIWRSLDTSSWEDGKHVTFVNNTVSDSAGARIFLFENQEGGSGTQFRYLFNGVPPIIGPGDSITFKLNTTDGFLDFVSSSCFGTNAEAGFTVYSDFIGGPAIASGGAMNGLGPFAGIQGNGSSAYTSSFQSSPVNAFGVLDLSTHTSSTGAFFVGSTSSAMMRGGMGAALFLARVTPSTALSDGSNTYTLIAGFNDAQFGAPVDAVGWKYDQAAATVWRTSTISNSTETVNDQSGFTVSISTMPYLGVFCNGDWTNIEFFYSVDGQTWVIGNAHTTNIPTGSSRAFGFGVRIQKSAGTTARLASIDLMGIRTMHIRA